MMLKLDSVLKSSILKVRNFMLDNQVLETSIYGPHEAKNIGQKDFECKFK